MVKIWACKNAPIGLALLALCLAGSVAAHGQPRAPAKGDQKQPAAKTAEERQESAASFGRVKSSKPKLVVMIVVDQMRGDYVDKFRGQWKGGLKRLVEQGAWYRAAAYPYAATETCVGHSTISTGAFPATHGMISNAWWDRETQKNVTCTSDPKAKNVAYAGGAVKGGDTAGRMTLPAFAEELKFQSGGKTRVVTFSLKARAAISLAGRTGNAVTWFDSGAWTTSDAYKTVPFVETYVTAHPVKADLGASWTPSLPPDAYLYESQANGAHPPAGWDLAFPHRLHAEEGAAGPDETFYEQWSSSPFADNYLTNLAETAVDSLALGKGSATDYLGVSYSSPDYVGHEFGPRSWEIQDILARLDQDLGELFTHLDHKIGAGNYVVALSADHGVVPIPEDLVRAGETAGWLNLADVRAAAENALSSLGYAKPVITGITAGELYFASGVYEKLKSDSGSLASVVKAIESVPGVLQVYRSDEVAGQPATANPLRRAVAASYFAGRSGDLFIVPKPYWPMGYFADGDPAKRRYGTTHGTPYYYDQHVPILLMGLGIQPGQYLREVTPADIAPTLAALCGITLAGRDGHVLTEAVRVPTGRQSLTTPR